MRTFLLGVLLYIVGLMLCVSLLFAQHQEARMSLGVVGGGVPAAGGVHTGNLVHETFDTTGGTCGDGSHTNCLVTWTVTGTVDFNSTNAGKTGFTSNCALFDSSSWAQTSIEKEFAGDQAVIYISFYLYATDLSNVSGDLRICTINASNDGVLGYFGVGVTGADALNFYYRDGESDGQTGVAAAINTSYYVQLFYDNTNNVMTWLINGSAQTALSSPFVESDARKVLFGAINGNNYAPVLKIDAIDVDTTQYP